MCTRAIVHLGQALRHVLLRWGARVRQERPIRWRRMTAIEMLKRGGSAVDAAVAANACLGFLEPTSSGLGGDCYAMLWDPKQSKVMGMASSGKSPKALSP